MHVLFGGDPESELWKKVRAASRTRYRSNRVRVTTGGRLR